MGIVKKVLGIINKPKKKAVPKSRFAWNKSDVTMHPSKQKFSWDKDIDVQRHKKLHESVNEELGDSFKSAPLSGTKLRKENPSKGLLNHYQTNHDSFSQNQHDAIHEYKTGNAGNGVRRYEALNSHLRQTSLIKKYPETLPKATELDHHLQSVSKPIPSAHHVYRGFGNNETTKWARGLKKGDSFTDHGYTSTTLQPKTAESFSSGDYFSKDHSGANVNIPKTDKAHYVSTIAKIHLPKGTKAHYLDIKDHNTKLNSLRKSEGGLSSYSDEREVLLHKGTKFNVLGHSIHPNPSEGPNNYLHVVHLAAEPHTG